MAAQLPGDTHWYCIDHLQSIEARTAPGSAAWARLWLLRCSCSVRQLQLPRPACAHVQLIASCAFASSSPGESNC